MRLHRTHAGDHRTARRLLLAALVAAAAVANPGGARASPEVRTRTAAEIVQNTCVLCHGTGQSGAPRIGATKDWRARARVGLDGLVRSAAEGKGGMPVRGGMPDLSDAELRAAIAYMSGLENSLDGRQ